MWYNWLLRAFTWGSVVVATEGLSTASFTSLRISGLSMLTQLRNTKFHELHSVSLPEKGPGLPRLFVSSRDI